MKIAMVFDGLQIGGIERVGADYAKMLCQMGHDVTIVNLKPKANEMKKEFPESCSWIEFYYSRKFAPEQYAQLVKKGFVGTCIYQLAEILLSGFDLILKTILRVRYNLTFDLIIAFSGHFNDLNFVANSLLKNQKKMCWLHGALYSYLLISDGYYRLYNRIKNLVVLVSDAQEEVLAYNKSLYVNINKLYNPTFIKERKIDRNHVQQLINEYGKFVLMVSRFEYPHKDQFTVAKMLKIVREKYGENLDLVFVGNGPNENDVKELVASFPEDIQKHIHFEGSRLDVQDYYNAAFALVHASVAGEGLPTIMLEALTYSLPMVVTDSKTGPREILGDNKYGLLCQVENPDDMAEKVAGLVENSNLYNDYKEKSKERIRDFAPDVIQCQLEKIIKSVMSGE